VTYLGEIVVPSPEQLQEMQSTINNFVLRGTPWAGDKLYLKPSEGGLGLINLNALILALKSSWFRRIHRYGYVDTWRVNLMKSCFFNINCFRQEYFAQNSFIEKGISDAFWTFLLKLWSTGKNIIFAPVFRNPLITMGTVNEGNYNADLLGANVLGNRNFADNKVRILGIVINDCFVNGTFVSHAVFNNILGFETTFAKYFAIRNAVMFAIKKYCKGTLPPVNILTFLALKGGSKQFRRYLVSSTNNASGKKMIQSFAEIAGVEFPHNLVGDCLGLWNHHYLPVEIRVFALQWYRNSLPVSARVGNRYCMDNIDQRCKLCLKLSTGTVTVAGRETFIHLFWECTYTKGILKNFFGQYYRGTPLNVMKNLVFWASRDLIEQKLSDRIVLLLLTYEIWRARGRKYLPSIATIDLNMYSHSCKIFAGYKKLVPIVVNDNNAWFRKWWPGVHNRE
jgi:hypothetical protein